MRHTQKTAEEVGTKRDLGALVGDSAQMRRLSAFIEKAAKVDIPVLIEGETGTGKELVALSIHSRSPRAEYPFVSVNTGALPAELVASELFGHVKGAFTGAHDDKEGRFTEADGGTLFMDEVATMDERTQVTLLRVLESQYFRPVGATKDKQTHARVIAATNEDLAECVEGGAFREDLYYRMSVFKIRVPALRERLADLPALSQHFIQGLNEEFGFEIEGIDADCLQHLKNYDWPGNVRELKNVIAQAAVMQENGMISASALPGRIREGVRSEASERVQSNLAAATDDFMLDADMAYRTRLPLTQADVPERLTLPLGRPLADIERAYVLKTMSFVSHNKTKAASVLGISRKALYDKLKRWKTAGRPGARSSDGRARVRRRAARSEPVKSASAEQPVTPIKVLIADDHQIVREGIATMLEREPQFLVVGEAEDGESAIELTSKTHPNVVIMDVHMPKMTGINATSTIAERYPNVHVIGFSVDDDPSTERAMLKAGATAHIRKDDAPDRLCDAIIQANGPAAASVSC